MPPKAAVAHTCLLLTPWSPQVVFPVLTQVVPACIWPMTADSYLGSLLLETACHTLTCCVRSAVCLTGVPAPTVKASVMEPTCTALVSRHAQMAKYAGGCAGRHLYTRSPCVQTKSGRAWCAVQYSLVLRTTCTVDAHTCRDSWPKACPVNSHTDVCAFKEEAHCAANTVGASAVYVHGMVLGWQAAVHVCNFVCVVCAVFCCVLRPAAGYCDIPEVCVNGKCPTTDKFKHKGTRCPW
jgi:hypothetical protein